MIDPLHVNELRVIVGVEHALRRSDTRHFRKLRATEQVLDSYWCSLKRNGVAEQYRDDGQVGNAGFHGWQSVRVEDIAGREGANDGFNSSGHDETPSLGASRLIVRGIFNCVMSGV